MQCKATEDYSSHDEKGKKMYNENKVVVWQEGGKKSQNIHKSKLQGKWHENKERKKWFT